MNFLHSYIDASVDVVDNTLEHLQLTSDSANDRPTPDVSVATNSRFFRWNKIFGLSSGNPYSTEVNVDEQRVILDNSPDLENSTSSESSFSSEESNDEDTTDKGFEWTASIL